jgi:hypothetical protein
VDGGGGEFLSMILWPRRYEFAAVNAYARRMIGRARSSDLGQAAKGWRGRYMQRQFARPRCCVSERTRQDDTESGFDGMARKSDCYSGGILRFRGTEGGCRHRKNPLHLQHPNRRSSARHFFPSQKERAASCWFPAATQCQWRIWPAKASSGVAQRGS